MAATGNRSKIWCCEEQYCIGTWNVRSTNQGALEVVKQEMGRVNVDILGISELKWTGMGELNSDDQYLYYCGQDSLRRNGEVPIINKSPKHSTWVQSQEWHNDLCSFPRQTIQYHNNPSLCPSTNSKEAEVEWFYRDLQDLLQLTRKKKKRKKKKSCSFHHRRLECKSRKSRDSWNNRQIWPWSTEWTRAKAKRV